MINPVFESFLNNLNLPSGINPLLPYLSNHPNIDKVIIYDFSWHLYKSYYSFKNLTAGSVKGSRPVGHIYGILQSVQSLYDKNTLQVFALDGFPDDRAILNGFRQENPSIFGDEEPIQKYKAGRTPPEFDIYQDVTLILLLASNIPNTLVARATNLEADDIGFTLSSGVPNNIKVYLFSGDNDWLQASKTYSTTGSDNVFVMRSINRGTPVVLGSDYNKFPYTNLPIYRALKGDISDSIPPVYPRLNTQYVKELSDNLNTPYDFEFYDSELHRKYKDKININRFIYNYYMCKLSLRDGITIYDFPYNPKLVKVAEKYKLSSYLRFTETIRKEI